MICVIETNCQQTTKHKKAAKIVELEEKLEPEKQEIWAILKLQLTEKQHLYKYGDYILQMLHELRLKKLDTRTSFKESLQINLLRSTAQIDNQNE